MSHRKSKVKLDWNDCKVETNDVPAHLIQITASEDEVLRRIEGFEKNKRNEINISNILDFTTINPYVDENSAEQCSRTMAATIKKDNDQYYHLKVRRVNNIFGPQVDSNYTNTLDNLLVTQSLDTTAGDDRCSVLNNRVKNIEKYLSIPMLNATGNINNRVKAIEQRVLFLESISPEYKHFLNLTDTRTEECIENKPKLKIKHKVYSINELEAMISADEPQLIGD